jgi:N-methylhydantoinase B
LKGEGREEQPDLDERYDPVALEILWSRLIAIVDEMGTTLVRTAFSPAVREGSDFTCVLLDAAGNAIAQSTQSIPAFAGILPITTKHFLKRYPASTLQPGDVLITNDPWVANGHLEDTTTVATVFYEGELVGFVGVITHLPDVGGKQLSSEASEIFEEGLRIPMSKLYIAGKPNEDLFNIIEHNVRVPDQVFGDLRAHVAAHDTGAKKLLELMREAGLRDLTLLGQTIQEVSERAMRKAISEIPDGDYDYEVYGDGFEELVRIKVKVSVKGDNIVVDYEGSSRQSAYGNNSVKNYTYASTVYSVKCILNPHIPNNEGCFKPIKVKAPPGSILNVQLPAAVGGRHLVGHMLPAAVFGALGLVVPEKALAEWGTPLWIFGFHGQHDDGERFVILPPFHGGQGASAHRDGLSCLAFPSNNTCFPTEIVETLVPLLIKEKSLAADSGGPGKLRGGCGQKIVVQSDSPFPITVAPFTEKTKIAPLGISGGHPGGLGSIRLNGVPVEEPKGLMVLKKNDCLEVITPGGGGFGDPRQRDGASLWDDVVKGYVSIEQAQEKYGIIIDPNTEYQQ